MGKPLFWVNSRQEDVASNGPTGVEVDPKTRDVRANYHFLTSAVMPRPIAWVTTVDPHTGVLNAAPFSWFQAVCSDPPMVMLAIQRRADGSPKDTTRNIRASGEFVVNVSPKALAEAMVRSSGEYPPDISEVEALGLRIRPSKAVKPPRLADSPVHLECRLHQEIPLGQAGGTSLLIGEVVHIAADDAVLDARQNVDPAKLVLVARLGGQEYIDTERFFTMRRPTAEDLQRRPEPTA
ncbi:MAG TPA: flavin reductase family protein [Candidatus Thermoplasmatota archaeon]|nr:flavin reductase family protein [Candidatus Thermoplasmatota archaeon]